MADVLDILATLEKSEKQTTDTRVKPTLEKNEKHTTNTRVKPTPGPIRRTSQRTGRPTTRVVPRPKSVPPQNHTLQIPPQNITPRTSGENLTSTENFGRSQSQGPDSRRVSFADVPRPTVRRIKIPSKTDFLGSGFPFDTRLHKYGVGEEEWRHFTDEIIGAADVPGPSWMWSFQRKDITKRIKRALQYDGDLKRILKRWNKQFKQRRFQAWLELPNPGGESDIDPQLDGEARQQAKRESKRFRIVVTPDSEKPPSIYSRSSSLTRSVSGEAAVSRRGSDSSGSQSIDSTVSSTDER